MDEIAKTEARNYLSAAGFFLLAAFFLLELFANIGASAFVPANDCFHLAIGIGLLVIATLLVVLRRRDMIAILFFMMGFVQLFLAFSSPGIWTFILLGFLVLVALVTLTARERVKWILFLVPAIWFVSQLLQVCLGYSSAVTIVSGIVLAAFLLYCAFACASERIALPGSRLLTADESTDFKASGSVLGYMLFAISMGAFAVFYAVGNPALLSLAEVTTLKLIACILMGFVAILLFAVGRMRFTPVMFLLIAISLILSVYASGYMTVGIGILLIVLGLFAILRKESRILPGIMLVIIGCTGFISAISGGILPSIPWLSAVLNGIPALIAVYLSFVVYSQRRLPRF